jgi:hypothetical protein
MTGKHNLRIIPNCGYEDYLRLPGLRQTEFKRFMMESPAHFKDWVDAGKPDRKSDALRLGSLLDDLVFRGEAFVAEHWFITEPNPYDGRTKAGKAWKAEFELRLEESGVGQDRMVTVEEYHEHQRLARLLRTQSDTRQCLIGDGVLPQIAVQFVCEGVLCKCLLDFGKFTGQRRFIGDLKKTLSAERRAFNRQAENYGYYIQAAWNRLAVRFHDFPRNAPWFWVCAEAGPHGQYAKVWRAQSDRLDYFEGRIQQKLRRYRHCQETCHWPAYGVFDEPEELPTEAWQNNQTMDFFEYELNAGSTLATANAGGGL